MHLADPCSKFPYYEIYGIYLKHKGHPEYICLLKNMIANMYPEIIDIVVPIDDESITNPYRTFEVHVRESDQYYRNQNSREVYGWRVTPISIEVPYGNIVNHVNASYNWLSMTARTIRAIMHATRLLTNDTPDIRQYANIVIPWIPMDKSISKLNIDDLRDYNDIVLSMLSSNTWIKSKSVIMSHQAPHH